MCHQEKKLTNIIYPNLLYCELGLSVNFFIVASQFFITGVITTRFDYNHWFLSI